MYKRTKKAIRMVVFSILVGGVLYSSLNAAQYPGLIAWWRLDEGVGTTAMDSSGNNYDGKLYGGATWTAGIDWGGVYLDGIDDYIEIPNVLSKSATIAFWFKPDWDGTDPEDYRLFDASIEGTFFFIAKGAYNRSAINPEDFGFYFEDETDWIYENFEIDPRGVIFANTWFHLAITWEFGGGYAAMYINGKPMIKGSTFSPLGDFPNLNSRARFGLEVIDYVPSRNGAMGVIDNILIFNRALSAAEIESLMAVEVERASGPVPANEETNVFRDVTLSWTPGIVANKHNVYLADNFDDVNKADSGSSLLIGRGLNNNSFNPGRLEFSKTYFWKVDEVNAPPDLTVFKGNVWSFTVEPPAIAIPAENITATASSYMQGQIPENTINGSGLVDNLHSTVTSDMWVSNFSEPGSAWIMYEFNKLYKLHEILVWNYNGKNYLVGLGIKDVIVEYSTDKTNWVPVENVTEFAKARGSADYAHNTTVPFGDTLAGYVRITAQTNWGGEGFYKLYGLSEVRFMCIPLDARLPDPIDGATNVPIDVTLGWRPGREATKHNVYVSKDKQQVINGTADVATVTQSSRSLSSLDLARTYYWRVDEVNNVNAVPIWEGDVWSFTTQKYLVVDDFEQYDDFCDRIFYAWVDGFGHSADPDCGVEPSNGNGTGSTVGNLDAPFAEQNIVHEGSRQSMPLGYDNSAAPYYSEIQRKWAVPQNWTKGGANALTLWFYGDQGNPNTDRMYIKVNNAKVIYNGSLAQEQWQEFSVDLASLGIDLSNVTSITIGFERIGASGGSGKVLVDDIRLYAPME